MWLFNIGWKQLSFQFQLCCSNLSEQILVILMENGSTETASG